MVKRNDGGFQHFVRFPPWGHWPTSAFTRKQYSPNPAGIEGRDRPVLGEPLERLGHLSLLEAS
jgi:hypothetical protein